MSEPRLRPLTGFKTYEPDEMRERAQAFCDLMSLRRTVREFSDRAIPDGVIEACLETASAAPSGANMQPWHFSVVRDPAIRHRIRVAAEAEEREFYEHRASPEWLEALAPLGTDADKPFLDIAPCLIAIFVQRWGQRADGSRIKHYYPVESVGLATGFLIAALHQAGLATLTHTPSPMKFLNEILDRPKSERPFLLLVAGFPADNARVPDITRKSLSDIASWHDPE